MEATSDFLTDFGALSAYPHLSIHKEYQFHRKEKVFCNRRKVPRQADWAVASVKSRWKQRYTSRRPTDTAQEGWMNI